jgi:[ribosomal protein S5]-alanine N-acetyltransferase
MQNNSNELPVLDTERLVLRTIDWIDTDFIFRHFSDPHVTRYLFDEEPLTQPEQAKDIIRFYLDTGRGNSCRWVMIEKKSTLPIGTLGFHKWDPRNQRVEVGYDLQKDFWGQGLMQEAFQKIIHYGFYSMKVNRIDALVAIENKASKKLLERNAFQKEGTLRDYFFQGGQYHDHWLFSLLRKNWIP